MLRQRNHLVARTLGFDIMGLQHNQFLQIRMHLASLPSATDFRHTAKTTAENSKSSTARLLAPSKPPVKYAPYVLFTSM
jgi:hypothetical protein